MGFIFHIVLILKIQIPHHKCDSCVKQCVTETTQCWLNCVGDALCDYECSIQAEQCIQSCPCFSDCPSGCDECSNPICVCSIPDENPDYILCAAQVEAAYLKCLIGCPSGDAECVSKCARDYNMMIEQCPCQSGCPSGCPCEEYTCPAITTSASMTTTTATTTTSAMTTSTNSADSHTLVIWGGTSTSAILTDANDDTTYIQWGQEGEISRIDNCTLKRVGTLAIDMEDATGTKTENAILMCFPFNDRKRCYKGATPFTITETIERTENEHYWTYVASSKTHALAVGSGHYGNVQNAVELLDLSTWTWEKKSPYPFKSTIFQAPIIYVGNKFIMFGGSTTGSNSNYVSRIAAYTPITDEWTSEGNLSTARRNAGVITVGDNSFLIIGGYFNSNDSINSSEKCVYNGDQLECSYQDPILSKSFTHLFAVSSDYCEI